MFTQEWLGKDENIFKVIKFIMKTDKRERRKESDIWRIKADNGW